MWEDLLLVRGLRHGDADALARIYEKYKIDLLTLGAAMLGHPAPAEDCLHDVFVSLARHAPHFRLHSSLRGYLVTAMMNRARDHLRRRRPDVDLDHAPDLPAAPDDPAADAARRERSSLWLARLASLPAEQREVITLHLHGRLSFRQIARRQGASINTVQSRYRYGLQKLRSMAEEGARP